MLSTVVYAAHAGSASSPSEHLYAHCNVADQSKFESMESSRGYRFGSATDSLQDSREIAALV